MQFQPKRYLAFEYYSVLFRVPNHYTFNDYRKNKRFLYFLKNRLREDKNKNSSKNKNQ